MWYLVESYYGVFHFIWLTIVVFLCLLNEIECARNDVCQYAGETHAPTDDHSLASSCECKAGHWPITKSCYISNSKLSFDINAGLFGTNSTNMPDCVLRTWNITVIPTVKCSFRIQNALFLPIPYDKATYQSDGSNFYVIHVDTLLPLWNYFRTLNPSTDEELPIIFGFSFNIHGEVNLTSDAFIDPNKYWIRSVQLQFDHHVLVPGTMDGLSQFASRLHTSNIHGSYYPPRRFAFESGTICFRNVQLGLPLFDNPSRASVSRFAAEFREVCGTTLDLQLYCILTFFA